MNDKFPEDSATNTAQRIWRGANHSENFLQAHQNAGEVGERNDVGDEEQRRLEFFAEGFWRYLGDNILCRVRCCNW